MGDQERAVFPEHGIGLRLRLQQLLPAHGRVEVDDHTFRPQVKAHVVAGKAPAQNPAEDVFPGVLLHVVKAPVPVQRAGDRLPGGEGGGAEVDHLAALFMRVQHRYAAKGPPVPRLPAALGIERRPVQRDQPAAFSLRAGPDRGGELPQIRVLIIEPFCHVFLLFSENVKNSLPSAVQGRPFCFRRLWRNRRSSIPAPIPRPLRSAVPTALPHPRYT